jgi:hypothetical protein
MPRNPVTQKAQGRMVGRPGAPCQLGTTLRLDRTDLNACASLVADRKELAAMRHK